MFECEQLDNKSSVLEAEAFSGVLLTVLFVAEGQVRCATGTK